MNCQEVMELMQRQLDNDLDAEETSRMNDHIGKCPECAAMLERLTLLSRGLEQLPRVVPPYSLVDAILPELGKSEEAGGEQAAAIPPRGRRAGRERLGRTWLARLSGVVALGVAVGLLIVNGPKLGPSSTSRNDAASLSSPQARAKMMAPPSAAANDSKFDMYIGEQSKKSPSSASAAPAPSASIRADKNSVIAPTAKGGASGSAGTAAPASHEAEPSGSPITFGASDNAGSGAGDGGGKANRDAATIHPAESANPRFYSITADDQSGGAEESALSPDGKWNAVVQDGTLRVFRQSDGVKVYESTPDGARRSGLTWSEDSSRLDFTVTDSQGNATPMSLAVPDMKEKSR